MVVEWYKNQCTDLYCYEWTIRMGVVSKDTKVCRVEDICVITY